jgi:hypothetical protein
VSDVGETVNVESCHIAIEAVRAEPFAAAVEARQVIFRDLCPAAVIAQLASAARPAHYLPVHPAETPLTVRTVAAKRLHYPEAVRTVRNAIIREPDSVFINLKLHRVSENRDSGDYTADNYHDYDRRLSAVFHHRSPGKRVVALFDNKYYSNFLGGCQQESRESDIFVGKLFINV